MNQKANKFSPQIIMMVMNKIKNDDFINEFFKKADSLTVTM